jgi:hypothetical protein
MLWLITAVFTWLQSFVRSRHDLGLEIIVLRHQLVVLKRRSKRARLQRSDRLFWILPWRVRNFGEVVRPLRIDSLRKFRPLRIDSLRKLGRSI